MSNSVLLLATGVIVTRTLAGSALVSACATSLARAASSGTVTTRTSSPSAAAISVSTLPISSCCNAEAVTSTALPEGSGMNTGRNESRALSPCRFASNTRCSGDACSRDRVDTA
ncbi:MAG: hypothetical protein AAFY58_06830, partial [Planctomycetota bacterium]